MATGPRGGGVGPNRASPPVALPVYKDFRPVSERHQDEEAEKLILYLPGFMKESIRVTTEGKNTVRVGGERFVGGNTWHRFQEDFQAPDDCNMSGIHAKFENGFLIITMPWKMPKQLLEDHTKQSPPMIPHKDDNVPPRTTHPTVETPRKPTPLKPTAQHADKDQDSTRNETLESTESSKTRKGDNVPPRTTYPTTEAAPRKPTPLKPTAQHADKDQDSTRNETLESTESSKTQKGDNVPPRTTYPTTDATPRKPTPLKPTAQHADKDQDSTRNETLESTESSKTQRGDNVPPRTTYPTTKAAPRKPTPLKPTAQLPKPHEENKFSDDQLTSAESSKTQKGDEDIDYPALRTTPLDKTSGEREKPKDEKKILEGLVGSIESKMQKSNEENLDHNRTQLTESGKEVEMKESHDAGGKIVSEKSEDLRKEFQEKVDQKGSKKKGSTKTGCADYFWKFISWFTCED
ncbi:hypothetical protein R3W88_002730 [Solanum pinnatisectum]|uniref:SHSP domain-containing protein n=1 Tax=Solanum pinnatisectum TaxID=50273 RepID=A0AAV9MMZ5_9SOLN|nr:hypothetical protein R3W88_002730 [Solanum pinnatisectum]